jgi:probable rRNA maturation factor
MNELCLANRQKVCSVNLPLLRKITRRLLRDSLPTVDWQLGVYLVGRPEIARLNQTFLHHEGPTDVISFNYGKTARATELSSPQDAPGKPSALRGEIFICLEEARAQARQFRTSWQSELIRYLIHGVLHLRGFEDGQTAARRAMRQEEKRWLHQLSKTFSLRQLARRKTARGFPGPNRKLAPLLCLEQTQEQI